MDNKNKKNLLVTLADENYIEQAKQLFSSVYWNAGWKGDYMLLAHEVPEKKLKWFRDKGILIKKCKPLVEMTRPLKPVILCKFYMFTREFKKWKNIVYLDADMIVRASLDELTEIGGFAAVLDDLIVDKLIDQFIPPFQMNKENFNKFKRKYNINSRAFKSGVMAFDTDIIEKGTFLRLKNLYEEYKKLAKPWGIDQPIFNLFFYKKWEELPIVYNFDMRDFKFLNSRKMKAVILHLDGKDIPWFLSSRFYNEWKYNLEKADKINPDEIQPPRQKFTKSEIRNYSRYLKIRSIFYFPNWIHFLDYQIGRAGILLYDKFPKLYFKLKKLKDKNKK